MAMSDTVIGKGSCQCGAVQVAVDQLVPQMHVCHCGMCRKLTGGPLFAVNCGTSVAFEGKENISIYDSSDWAERGFCSQCGTALFYRLKEKNQHFMPAGLFEGNETFPFKAQLFIEEKPANYDFKNETAKLTGEQVFASGS